jgi:hypothetical protein
VCGVGKYQRSKKYVQLKLIIKVMFLEAAATVNQFILKIDIG